ncbi:unnamed protein product [Rhizoctonia solani]|uniref:Uncharacterized protein n=1 Tax=Rhizoctonia solani TaxID=456999 RepID=A0A8H3B9S9_9AGAM|nr:unnamed protein product [Rhizoctonia solani]
MRRSKKELEREAAAAGAGSTPPPDKKRVKTDEAAKSQKKSATLKAKTKAAEASSAHVLMDLRKAASHPMLFRRRFDDGVIRKMAKLCLKEPEFMDSVEALVVEDMEVMTDAELQVFAKRYKSCRKLALTDECFLDAGKVEVLLELVGGYRKEGRRVLVFSQFTQILDILKVVLDHVGIKFLVLTGSTPVDERQSLVDEFTEDESIPVFLLSTRAGGMGINLTAASVVIMFDQDFNPHNDRQAADRSYRIGQKRDVDVVKLITKETIEEDILRLGQTKLALDEAVAGDAAAEEGSEGATEKAMKSSLLNVLRERFADETAGDSTSLIILSEDSVPMGPSGSVLSLTASGLNKPAVCICDLLTPQNITHIMRSPSPDPLSDVGTDSTQPQTQPQTAPPECNDPPEIHPDSWGLLVPCSAGQPSGIIQLKKRPDHVPRDQSTWSRSGLEEHSFKIGRGSANDFVLPGQKISSQHCTLTWSGRVGDKPSKENAVVVHDNSSNGTFINGKRIGKTKKSLLTPGDELSFGLPGQDLDDLDYRYIFRRPTEILPALGNGVFLEYELGPALGRGAFATVRRALHRASGQWFACKVITKSRFVHNPRSRQMFEREVTIMKEFDHPHICKLVAHFEDESTIWLILELITGGDLLEAVINENGLSEEETRQLATEMCLAMEYSHSKGNILLTDTVPRHAKIADFGLAKAVDSGTFLKTFCGTPTYLAPEVVLRAQDAGYNELVDSWSLGVIVWSMLTNTVPFTEDEDDMYTRFQRRQVDWSQVSSFGLSHDCIDWMKRMLVQDPNHRMGLGQALEHPWLAPLANAAGYERPQPRQRTMTPTDSSGSTAANSVATIVWAWPRQRTMTPTDSSGSTAANSVAGSLISSDPPGSSQALASQALERCSQVMSSMVIDGEEEESLGSASLVSGAVSVASGFTATTHASDASNLRLVISSKR